MIFRITEPSSPHTLHTCHMASGSHLVILKPCGCIPAPQPLPFPPLTPNPGKTWRRVRQMRERRRRSVAGLGVVLSSSPRGPMPPFQARLFGGGERCYIDGGAAGNQRRLEIRGCPDSSFRGGLNPALLLLKEAFSLTLLSSSAESPPSLWQKQ